MKQISKIALCLASAGFAAPAAAEDGKEPRRTRVGLGVQLVPSYPGSDTLSPRPLIAAAGWLLGRRWGSKAAVRRPT
jgi:hypothetical protein